MTDEGRRGDPMDEIELAQAIKDAARAAREMFIALLHEGFTEEQSDEAGRRRARSANGMSWRRRLALRICPELRRELRPSLTCDCGFERYMRYDGSLACLNPRCRHYDAEAQAELAESRVGVW